jgi:hypothetical protein
VLNPQWEYHHQYQRRRHKGLLTVDGVIGAVLTVAGIVVGLLAAVNRASSGITADTSSGNTSAACAEIQNAVQQAGNQVSYAALQGAYADVSGTSAFALAVQDLASNSWPSRSGLQAISATCNVSVSILQVLNPNG